VLLRMRACMSACLLGCKVFHEVNLSSTGCSAAYAFDWSISLVVWACQSPG
jgi:hypothetical protein